MYKKICDRCEKEIPKEIDNVLELRKITKTRYGRNKLYHLCNNCLEYFEEFMKIK